MKSYLVDIGKKAEEVFLSCKKMLVCEAHRNGECRIYI